MKNAEKSVTEDRQVAGRALVDIPGLGLKCGEYAVVAESALTGRIEAGEFDPNATETNSE